KSKKRSAALCRTGSLPAHGPFMQGRDPMDFPAEFLDRERALLGPRFAELYAYAAPEPARGVTVNTLRCPPERFAAQADFPLAPSPFCPAAFTTAADWRPGRHPWHHAGVFYAQEPS